MTLQVAFDAPIQSASAGLATLSGQGGTPLSDVILSFDGFLVVGACADTADTTGGDDDYEDHDSTEVSAFHLSPASEGDDDESGEDECSYWTALDSTVTLSASGLDTTLTKILGTVVLPEGWYEEIKLHLVGAWVVTADDDTLDVGLPGHNDFLKVDSPFHVDSGGVTPIAIVFDANRSVVESPPGSRNFHLKPVLHAYQGWYDHEDHDEADD